MLPVFERLAASRLSFYTPRGSMPLRKVRTSVLDSFRLGQATNDDCGEHPFLFATNCQTSIPKPGIASKL